MIPVPNRDFVDFGLLMARLGHRPLDEFDDWHIAIEDNNPRAFAPDTDISKQLSELARNNPLGMRPNLNPWSWEYSTPALGWGDEITAYPQPAAR